MVQWCRVMGQRPTCGGVPVFSSTSFSPAAFSALSWLLDQIITQVRQALEAGGGDAPTRRKTQRATPNWLPVLPVDEDETLLFLGLV